MDTQEFSRRVRSLPIIRHDSNPFTWLGKRNSMRNHMRHHPVTEFLQWSTVKANFYTGETEWVRAEALEMFAYDMGRYENACRLPNRVGKPDKDGFQTIPSDANMVHQAYHLYLFERFTGWHVHKMKRVVELGVGYGAMINVFRNLNFTGAYHLIDFEEMLLLSEWYLSNSGHRKGELYYHNSSEAYLTMRALHEYSTPDLFIACHSMGEIPPEERIIPDAKAYLFAYHGHFDKVDNQSWFRQAAEQRKTHVWAEARSPQSATIYLFGVRNDVHKALNSARRPDMDRFQSLG